MLREQRTIKIMIKSFKRIFFPLRIVTFIIVAKPPVHFSEWGHLAATGDTTEL